VLSATTKNCATAYLGTAATRMSNKRMSHGRTCGLYVLSANVPARWLPRHMSTVPCRRIREALLSINQ
jgi:hypothetical protein